MKRTLSVIKIIALVLLAVILLVLIGGSIHRAVRRKVTNANPDIVHTGLYVDGVTLRKPDGEAFVMKGVNHAHSWYRDQDETALDAIAATGANTVRIVLACGIKWQKDDAETIRNILQMVKDRELMAILEVHDGVGSNDISVLEQIADYWCEMAEVLQGTEDFCIVNIANEWYGGWSTSAWAKGYTKVIPKLRAAGIANTIMVDAAGWGQFGTSIDLAGKKVFDSDPDANTMFSVHMYGLSGGQRWTIRYNLNGGRSQNLCMCVGEFGYTHSDGDVKEDYLMDYCKEKQIGYLAWSWKGNSGGVEYLDLAEEWDGSRLSEWGSKVVESFED